MRHILSILVENRGDDLARLLGLFRARGYPIESLTVAETTDPDLLRITLVTRGQDSRIEQIIKRIDNQVRVLQVLDLTALPATERELALVCVKAEVSPTLLEILKLISTNHMRLTDVSASHLTLEATGDSNAVNEIIQRITALGVGAIVRGGTVAITNASPSTTANRAMAADVTPVDSDLGLLNVEHEARRRK